LVAVGWLTIVFHDDLLLAAENAAASYGAFGASATTYRRADRLPKSTGD
jgi:hypothetical protein